MNESKGLTDLRVAHKQLTDKIEALLDPSVTEGRDLNDGETKTLEGLRTELDGVENQIGIREDIEARTAKFAANVDEVSGRSAALAAGGAAVSRIKEPDIYVAGGPHRFLEDYLLSVDPDMERRSMPLAASAAERISRYRHHHKAGVEGRDAASTAFAGLVPPQYMVEQAEASVRSMRPTANACNMRALPPTGMEIRIPLVTTATTATSVAQNANSSETDPAVTDAVIPVHAVRGAVDITFEAIHRGMRIEDVTLEDLAGAVSTQINAYVLNGTGSNQPSGLLKSGEILAAAYNQTADNTSPTAALAYGHIVDLITGVSQRRFAVPSFFTMHPRRLGYLAKSVDTTGRALFQASTVTAQNTLAVGRLDYGNTGVSIAGVPVVSDAAIPTTLDSSNSNEDVVIAVYAPDAVLYESPMMLMTGDPLLHKFTHTLLLAKYMAFKLIRNTSAAAVRGTIFAAT